MKKLIVSLAILLTISAPTGIWASPGPLDQYGGHYCLTDCYQWDNLHNGEYHFHNVTNSPNYLSNIVTAAKLTSPSQVIFYQPEVSADKLLTQPDSLKDNVLVEDASLDASFCGQAKVFSGGLYDQNGFVRIKPVCFNSENIVRASSTIKPVSYYKDLPVETGAPITKVYHYTINQQNKRVFTDRPELSELKDQIIQGETDNIIYYIYSGDYNLSLRQITPAKAQSIFGADYQDKLLYFNDSIVYSFKIGTPLN